MRSSPKNFYTTKLHGEPLDKVVNHLEEEARMILPGIQALFGFQLVAIFNQRFVELSLASQVFHFVALLCSAASVLLVLTPAAYHQQVQPAEISNEFCRMSSKLLVFSLLPLAVGTSLDLYVIGKLIFKTDTIPISAAAVSLMLLLTAWFIFPRLSRSRLKVRSTTKKI